jgi:phospholipid-binding lipoprotein MlaA
VTRDEQTMPLSMTRPPIPRPRAVLPVVALAGLAACATPEQPVEINDPFEATNRRIHEFNKGFDRNLLRPTAVFYGETLPQPVRKVIGNLADNISLTGYVLNDVLQAQGEDAIHNSFRFALNSTLGVGGIFDPAASFGLEARDTGFGETLFVWGVEEGAYVELPLLGPSTQREAVGRVVNFFTNADSYALDGPSALAATGVGFVDLLNVRYDLLGPIDSVFYESEDSYAQTRSLYLQNLRFNYAGEDASGQVTDIYDEVYDE